MVAALRSRLGVYVAVLFVVVAVTALAIVGYRVYITHFADTPDKAARAYLDLLNAGDMVKLYEATEGAATQTQAEFAATMGAVLKDKRLNTAGAAIEPIGRKDNVSYYRVMVRLSAADGSYRRVPLVLATLKDGAVWRTSIFLPPAAAAVAQ